MKATQGLSRNRPDHVLLVGVPGTGKTIWARNQAEDIPFSVLDTTHAAREHIRRVAGLPDGASALPFRAPHHTCSVAGLRGTLTDGWLWRPGELSLAHGGVLLLDEVAEFSREAIDAVVEALETGTVSPSRTHLRFPAAFRLVASTNPCPCGWRGAESRRRCECSDDAIKRYEARIPAKLRALLRVVREDEYRADIRRRNER